MLPDVRLGDDSSDAIPCEDQWPPFTYPSALPDPKMRSFEPIQGPSDPLTTHKLHPKHRTSMCRNWLKAGDCPYGDLCNFAHGREQLRTHTKLPPAYRTFTPSREDSIRGIRWPDSTEFPPRPPHVTKLLEMLRIGGEETEPRFPIPISDPGVRMVQLVDSKRKTRMVTSYRAHQFMIDSKAGRVKLDPRTGLPDNEIYGDGSPSSRPHPPSSASSSHTPNISRLRHKSQ